MVVLLAIATSILGFGLASYYDLKTTEVPDTLTNFLILFGILLSFLNFLIFNQINYFINSLFFGTIFLSLGFLLYYTGIWGGADAKLLGIVGFLIPSLPNIQIPFPLIFLPNFFIISSVYLIFYGIIYSFLNPKTFEYMKKIFKRNFYLWLLSTILIFSVSFYIFQILSLFKIFSIVLASLPTLYLFSKAVEKNMIKKIKTQKLKVGDVLASSKIWEGLKKNEVLEIRKKKKYVFIKEGVRFAPTFFITLIFSLIFKDLSLKIILFLIS